MKSILFLLTIAFSATLNIRSQVGVGDPGVVSDPSKYDVDYPQMERWAKTGVEGGIPFLDSFDKTATMKPGNSADIQLAIDKMASSLSGEETGIITLTNGRYIINESVIIDSKEYLIDDRFKELFWEEGESSKELIFSTHALAEVFVAKKLLYVYPEMAGGWHQPAPFNEVADQYLCTDGLPIEESTLYDVNNPFENRDPRLYETLLIPGRSMFKGNLYTAHPNAESDKDKVSKQANIWTGYSIYKLADENYDGNLRTSGSNTVVFRYAEVLLGYLESLIESGSALTQADLDLSINELRLRAAVNMPIVTVTDNETLREVVRRERFCELAFEGVRYFDLLRWGLTDHYLNKQFHGMKLTNDPVAWNSDPESFGKVNDDGFLIHVKRNFVKGRNELWPIPQSELDINKKLVQNPNYN